MSEIPKCKICKGEMKQWVDQDDGSYYWYCPNNDDGDHDPKIRFENALMQIVDHPACCGGNAQHMRIIAKEALGIDAGRRWQETEPTDKP